MFCAIGGHGVPMSTQNMSNFDTDRELPTARPPFQATDGNPARDDFPPGLYDRTEGGT